MFFSSSFRCCYLTIDLVRSPIIGCEGTSIGLSYDHDSNVVRLLSTFVLGTKIILKGNFDSVIEGLWSFFDLLVFAKIPYMRNMAILYQATKWNNPRGGLCASVLFSCLFLSWIRVFYLIGFNLSIQNLITSIVYMKTINCEI